MSKPAIWLASLAVALGMSVVWGDDDGAALVAEDRADAIAAAQAAARHDAVVSAWTTPEAARDAR